MRNRAVAIAWVATAVGVIASLAGAVLEILRPASVQGVPPPTPSDFQYVANGVLCSVAGLLIARRRPDNVIWMALAGAGLAGGLFGFLAEYTIYSHLIVSGGLPVEAAATWVSGWMFPMIPALNLLVLLLFPTGRTLGPRWRLPLWLVAGGFALLTGVLAFHVGWVQDRPVGSVGPIQNPLGIAAVTPLLEMLQTAAYAMLGAASLLGVVALVLRYRRGSSEERHQLKVLIYVAAFLPLGFLLYPLTSTEGPVTPLTLGTLALQSFGVLGLPVAIGVAILKYRLYDIDVVISRTLVYGALAAFITAVYVGIVVGVGTLVGSGGQPNLALSIVATAIVAVAFQPLRERLQKVANLLVYGKRATPYEVLSQFSERVAETYAADEALPRMARVLAEGTAAQRASVWLRNGSELRPAASWPESAPGNGARPEPAATAIPVSGQEIPDIAGADRAVAVRHQGELLGALSVVKRAGESLTPIEEKLLDDLARQAGLVLKNVGLTADLLRRLEELRASRQRLVAAQDDERRKLERNLHDGAQQNLVALKVKLGLAESFADRDPAKARQLLGEIKGDADEALETLRDLARGIYPPLLAEKGLGTALESQARKATLPVQIDADGVGRYSQEIEAAVYFCALEALQNVQKYAEATGATVRLRETDGELLVEVEDDGKGFDVAIQKRGSGTQNMEDRLNALGGTLAVTSAPGAGTTMQGSLPVAVRPTPTTDPAAATALGPLTPT